MNSATTTRSAATTSPADGPAITGFIFSLLGWFPLAIILGHVSRRRSKRDGMHPAGLATAATIIGYIELAVSVLAIVLIIVFAAVGSSAPPGP
jgi:Domain of unknown function (DUF4190)